MSQVSQKNQDKKNELQPKNSQIFHHLQNLLTNASLANLNLFAPLSLHQVFIYEIYILFQFHHFWNDLQKELASKSPNKASIGSMKLRLQKLQEKNKQAQKLKTEQPIKDNLENINNMLHYQGLSYVSKIIWTELINRYHNNLLVSHFNIKKIYKLVAQKYYWPTLHYNVYNYMKGYDICLALKIV